MPSSDTGGGSAPDRRALVCEHLVLVGMMGTGKTSVGEQVAARLGRPFVDSDAEIERRTGKTVRELWHEHGEAGYRSLETEALTDALARTDPLVIAAAGGVVLRPENRDALERSEARVVWLDADPHVLAERVAHQEHRPLLDDDPLATLTRLHDDRLSLYAEVADERVDTGEQTIDGLVAMLVEPRRVRVDLEDRSYDVLVGPGVRHRLHEVLPTGAVRAAVITQAGIGVEVDPGIEHRVFEIGEGETAKSLDTVGELCRELAAWGLTRGDVIVGVGGGVVTDVAGFVAAVYHRGVRVVQVPTTLLGMVDAAIGGKTGVNLPEGKNLVGAFWQPSAVVCDVDVLATLPVREISSGLGELAKYHFLTGDDLLSVGLSARVARAAEIKAEVVSGDEREGGAGATPRPGARSRSILNYGHTLGHALETTGAYGLRHGEAVAVGIAFAARLAERLGRIDAERVARHDAVLDAYGLERHLPASADVPALVHAMQRDKKAVRGLTFVLDGPDGVELVEGIDAAVVAAELEAMR